MLVPSLYAVHVLLWPRTWGGQPDPGEKGPEYGILTSVAAGLVMALLTFFHGDLLSTIFSRPGGRGGLPQLSEACCIDCMLTLFLFCFTGYNGCEKTLFVMIRSIIGAFFVRIPVAPVMSRMAPSSRSV